jgi:serine/threonine-protein kinase
MLDDVSPGQVLGRYELLLPVAKGGMASVWAARQKGARGFQKLVAIKTMLPGLVDDPSFERMFLDEAKLASQVRHPHVIETMDLGEQDRVLYLVMEWVNGEALSVIMQYAATRGGIPLPIAVHIATQACRGLHAAHELRDENGALVGLVHRDVSPQNVLVTYDGVVKVVDFGVAKATARLDTQTEAGQLKGKIAYMSPEQLRGEKIDRRADVFAMGILLYMMTTGKHPFRGDDQARTIARISSDEPAVLPSTLVPGYPPGLELCVMQALAKDPAKRFPSAHDMVVGLTRSLPSALRESTDEEVAEFVRRLLPERHERQKQALRQALEQADRRDVTRSVPPRAPEAVSDEAATVLENLSQERTPSADGRSLPGATASDPPPSFAPARSSRILLSLALAGSLILVLAIGLLVRRTDPRSSAALSSPALPRPENVTVTARPTHEALAPSEPRSVATAQPLPSSAPPSESAPAARPAPRPGNVIKRGSAAPRPTTSSSAYKGPFVSPIRNPGF